MEDTLHQIEGQLLLWLFFRGSVLSWKSYRNESYAQQFDMTFVPCIQTLLTYQPLSNGG